MDEPTKPAEMMQQLMADLTPEELEPRLELQVFIDPMLSLVTTADNNNNNNNNSKPPVVQPWYA